MASLSYDVIVLGDDHAGLVAACLCASRGMRVLLAEVGRESVSYKLGKETLPLSPQFVTGLETAAVDRVVAELNFQHLFKRKLEDLSPPCQLVAPRFRIEAEPGALQWAQAFRREIGTKDSWLLDADEAHRGFREVLATGACIPPTGFWERRELGKFLEPVHAACADWQQSDRLAVSDVMSDMMVTAELGQSPESAFAQARSISTARAGLSRASGEVGAWRSLFLDKFRNHNGEVRRVLPQSLEMGWGKVTGLRTLEDSLNCEYIIAALPIHQLLPLFGKKPPKRLIELDAETKPVAYRYTLNLVVHLSAIPEGMAKVVWSILRPEESPIGGNFATISTRPAARSGHAIVTLQGLAPARPDGSPKLHGMRRALQEHAEQIMPFLGTHLEVWDSPHEAQASGSSNKRPRSLEETVAPQAIWQCPEDPTTTLASLPYQFGTKNLSLASDQILPTLGLEGQFISGWSAAKLVSATVGKRKGGAKTSVLVQGSS